jgi:ElaB/YqjD/DUF883 family membrane-anchored ribosome-binding protein
MAEDSGFHYYLNWAKERIDEMDAILTALEAKAPLLQADLRARADQVLGELRKERDHFRDAVKQQAEAGEAGWISLKAKLEPEWNAFEAEVRKYVDSFAKQAEQQRAAFKSQADAQLKAWRKAAGQIGNAAKGFAAEHRSDFDALTTRVNSEAAAAEDRLRKLNEAGTQSWSALMSALTETRATFDRANQAARDAFKKA